MGNKPDSWKINYIPSEGGRFTGQLDVTADGLDFKTIFESSNKTIVKAIFLDVGTFVAAGGHTVYRHSNDETARIELPAAEISEVKATKKGLMKQAVVTMTNGEEFVFDYGMLSVKNLVAAIEAITKS